MEALGPLFGTGRIVDAILVVVVIEAVVLLRWRGRRNWSAVAGALLPGVLLMLAVRAALTGAGWPVVAGLLALSFPAHLYDLWRRPPGA